MVFEDHPTQDFCAIIGRQISRNISLRENEIGERGRNRTFDPRIKSAMLYRLSYAPRTIASIRHCSTNCCKRKIRKTLAYRPCLKRALDRYYALYVSMTYSMPGAQKDALLAIVGRNLDANFYVFRSLAIEN